MATGRGDEARGDTERGPDAGFGGLAAVSGVPDATVARRAEFISPGLFAVGLALAEAVLMFVALSLDLHPLVWLAGHVAIVSSATAVLWSAQAGVQEYSPFALVLISAVIAGPAGAVLAFVALFGYAREKPQAAFLAAWYQRIALAGDVDPVTDLYNTVAMGRGLRTSTVPPQVFERIMTHGTLEERQTALGLIARQFTSSYASALRLALVSPEPVIRVQAAAVAVKVRAELKTSMRAALALSTQTDHTAAGAALLAVQLRGMVLSELLEDQDAEQGMAAVRALVGRVIGALEAGLPLDCEPGSEGRALIETELLREGRYGAFRRLREQAAVWETRVGATGDV